MADWFNRTIAHTPTANIPAQKKEETSVTDGITGLLGQGFDNLIHNLNPVGKSIPGKIASVATWAFPPVTRDVLGTIYMTDRDQSESVGQNVASGIENWASGALDMIRANAENINNIAGLERENNVFGPNQDVEDFMTYHKEDNKEFYSPLNQLARDIKKDAEGRMKKWGSQGKNWGSIENALLNPAYWTDPRGLTADVSQGIGSSLPGLLLGLPIAGAFSTAPLLQGAAYGLLSGGTEAFTDAGSNYDDIYEAVKNEKTASGSMAYPTEAAAREEALRRTNTLFAKEFPALVASEALEGLGLVGKASKLLGPWGDTAIAKGAKNVITNMGLQPLSEGVTEVLQTAWADDARKKARPDILDYANWTDEYKDAFRAGVVGAGPTSVVSTVSGFVNPEDEEGANKGENTTDTQTSTITIDTINTAVEPWLGVRMDNGSNGCVEAVTKIGATTSDFLKTELDNGVVYVPKLVSDAEKAGVAVVDYSPENVAAGDIIVYGDNDHVVMADGQGGYVGNSSSQQKVVHGSDLEAMGDLAPTKIIKTGGTNSGFTSGNNEVTEDSDLTNLDNIDDNSLGEFVTMLRDTTTDAEKADLLNGMFTTDRNGNEVFVASAENKQLLQDNFSDEVNDFVNAQAEAQAKTVEAKAPKAKETTSTADNIEVQEGIVEEARSQQDNIDEVRSAYNTLTAIYSYLPEDMKRNVAEAVVSGDGARLISIANSLTGNTVNRADNVTNGLRLYQPGVSNNQGNNNLSAPAQVNTNNQNADANYITEYLRAMANRPVPSTMNIPVHGNVNSTSVPMQRSGNVDVAQGIQNVVNSLMSAPNTGVQANEMEGTNNGSNNSKTGNQSETTESGNTKNKAGEKVRQPGKKHAAEGEIVVTGDEFGEYSSIEELRAKAKAYYKKHLQGTSVNNPLVGDVSFKGDNVDFTGRGIKKALSTSAKENKLLLIKHLPELIKNAKEVSTEENVKNKRNVRQYIYLKAIAKIKGRSEPVVITIFEEPNGNRYYNHILPAEEKNSESLPVYPGHNLPTGSGFPAVRQQALTTDNIPQISDESNNAVNNAQDDKNKLSSARQNNENMSSPSSNAVYGKATEVITDSGKTVNVTYKLVSSDDLVMSHNPNNTFSVNKNYPSELQPRDRERASMQTQVNKMANSLRPADLASSRNLNNGAPVVNGDNVVINGNGRSMAIYRAQHAKGGKGKAYNEYLAEHAEEFGFTREQVEAVKNPVLVREVAEADQATTNDIINSTAGGARMSPSEQAKVDAEKVTPAMMDFYDGNEKGDLTTPGNKGFIGRLLHAIMDDNSENAYTDDKGNVNADGLQRIKRVLYYLAYRDDEMLAKMAESTDDNIRNVSTAMLASAPKMAQNNLMMEAGERNNVDITTPLVTAIKRYASIKKANGDINEYLEARDLFEEYADSQLTKDLVKFFEDNKRKVRIISELLNNAVEAVKKLGDPNQMSLFEGEKIPSGEEIVRGALNKTIRENNPSAENMNSLFEDNNTNETTEAQPAEQESQKAEKKNGTTGIKQDSGKNKEAISNDVVDTGNTQPTGIFGEFDQQDLLDAFGMTTEDNEVMAIPKLEGVTDIDAEIEWLEKEISKELNNISANPIFNPNLYMMAAKLAMAYMHKGINSLKKLKVQFAAKFGSDFSEEWGPAVFETVKTWPTNIPFNETQVLKTTRAVGALYDHGTRDLNSIEDRIFANLSTANRKRLSPMVESAYNGIKIFFDNMEANKNERPDRQSKGTNRRPEGVQSEVTEVNEKSTEGTGEVSGGRGEKKEGNTGSNEGENTSRVRSAGVSAGTELEETAGRGDSERGNKQPSPDLTPGEKSETPTEIPGKNWEIKESAAGKTGEKTRYNQNVAAIKLLKQLEAEGRMPTPAEQEILAAYNGWGSLADYFNANRKTKENAELRELLTPEEYKSAVSTINDAFYTSPGIVRAVWEGVSRLGFKGGRVLDPSMGVGNFFGCMPRGIMNKSSLHGVEIDNLTSRLAAMLYPEARVDNVGFEKSKTPDNFYDLVISNVPFSSIAKIDGYLLHNYFFANGIDKTRPGGLMVFITSQGTLTNGKDGARMRSYLTNKADMIAAYKLPTGAFDEAGTQVVTDIVIFQKHGENGERSEHAQNFTDVKTVGANRYGNEAPTVNNYFLQHKENIIGEMGVESTYQGPKVIVKIDDKADIAQKLNEAMQSLPEGIYKPVTRKENKKGRTVSSNPKIAADNATRDYEYYVSGGKVYQKENGNAKEVTGKKATVIKDYIKLRDVLDSLIATQLNPEVTEKQLQDLRVQLNKTYDAFVKKHGYLNEKSVAKNFNDDPMAGMVMALEKAKFEGKGRNKKLVSATKNDIFSKRTVEPIKEVTQANSPADALLFSLNNKGEVDLDYMAELMQAPKEAIIAGLKGRIYKNPLTEEYEAADEYLSGNVRQKLAQAEAAAEENPEYMDNVEALQKALPEDLVSSEIYVNLGSPWVPVSDIQDFINHLTGKKSKTSNVTYVKDAGKWVVDGYLESPKFSCPYMSLDDLLNCLLNNKSIEIYTQTRDKQKILNDEATNSTNAVANQIKEEFQNWIWTDKEREERLVRYYNNNFNNSVVREYDGSHLTFPGMNSDIHMRSHQKNVIWRMLQKGNTLIAHCVGAGKTFEMQAAGMEMRRLGIARKPLYLLPNNVVEQFAKEFRQLYPNAKLLVLTTTDLPDAPKLIKYVKDSESGITKKIEINIADLSEKERAKILEKRATRNRTLARIQTEDWDGIIMSHNMFQRLPMSPENTKATIQEQLDIAKSAYTEARMSGMSKSDVKRLEERISNLETKLDAVLNMKDDDIGIPFEKIGVDQVFVDEADLFKNLGYYSTMNNIKGLPNSNADRSFDMFAKTQWLSRAMGGRGIVFATGTPIANTMAEMYTMLRYLDLQGLKVAGLDNFDNWLRTFADIGADVERKPSGDGYRTVNRAKGFINMPELSKMFRKVADIKRQEDLDLDIPQLKNGHPTVVKIKPDPKIEKFLKEVVPKRIAAMKANRTGKDNMLVLTKDLRKMAFTDAKINACADQITNKFNETADIKGAQVVFCDIGVPKDDIITTEEDIESEKVYERLVRALIARGIPREQIAIAQSAKNREQLEEMFKKVDSGDIRIIIGSTTKMGAGTNFQHHLVALHDLDAPWRPRDIEQRHGRILRQGNPNKEVEIFNYVVQDSFDANMWEKLKNKATMIGQAMSNHSEARTVEDADAVALEFADIEGAATADPRFKERLQLDKDIKAQKAAQIMFQKQQAESKRVLEREPAKLKDYEERKAKVEKDIAERTDTSGEKFKAVIDGKVYTKRTDADKALTKVLKNVKGAIPVTIGKIGDMDIKARETEPDYTVDDIKEPTKIAIQLVNNWSYNVKTNSIAGLENTLKDGPEKVIKNIDALIDESQQKINLAEETLKAEDPYSEKLKKMQARFNQLDRELKGELVGNNAQETPVNQPASEEQKAPEAEQSVAVDEEKESEKAEPEQATPTVPTNEEYWNTDDREHTKTGAMMYCVTAKEQVDKDTYKQIADIAKKHGKGYWNRFNKAFTFTSAEDRAAFMEEAGAILAGVQEAKYSGEGTKFAKMINSNEYVADEDLTTWQKMLQEFGRILGMPVTFFKNKPYLHGYHVNGRTFINVNSDMSLSRTFWHETFHWLRNNNPALYDAMVAYIAEVEGIGQAQIDKYKSDNGRTTLTNEEAVEEMMADAMQDVRNRVKFLKDLGKENKTLAQRFVEWIHRIMDRFTDFFNVPGGLTTKQKNAMSRAFEKLARDMVDANGKPIFKTDTAGKVKFSIGDTTKADRKRDKAYMELVDKYQNATSDTTKAKYHSQLVKMVEDAAEEAGYGDAIPEQTKAYKVRTSAPPKKTIKVYKVFTVADDGSPTALFVSSSNKLPQNVWLDAQDTYHFTAGNGKAYVPSTKNPNSKGGATGTSVAIPNDQVRQELIDNGYLKADSKAQKITALAYRPGWHAGTLPFFPQGGTKVKGLLKGKTPYVNMHRYNQVVFECEIDADKNYTDEAHNQDKARNKDGSLNAKNADLQYLPEGGFYYYATNPMTSNNPNLGAWVITDSVKINRALTEEECNDILHEHGLTEQLWEGGELDLASLGYTGAQYDAAKKTLAPITYDDDGNIIPLSERFNPDKEDIRFSVSNDTSTKENVSAMTEEQMLDEVKQAFPTAKNINANGSRVTFILPNGHKVTVDYVKRIGLTEAEKRQAAADYGREITDSDVIEGRYHGLGQEAFIEIAEGGREGTINHEAFHYAMESALTQKMKDFLNKKYKSEEAMAEAYRKWCNDRAHSDKLGKIWNKVKDFASSISNLLGIQTKQGIFKDISSGDVFESANNLNRIKNKLSVDDTRRISLNNPPINEDLMNEFVSELNSIIDNQVKSFEEQGYTAIEIADMFNQEQYSYYNFMNTDFTKALTKFISKYRYNYKLTNKQKMSNQEIYDYLTNIAHANFDSHEEAIAVFDYISKGYKEVLENANRYLRIICGAKKEVEQIHYQFRNWRDCETYHNQHGRPNDQEAEKLQGTVLKNVQTYDGFKLSIGQQHKNYLQRLWDRLMTAVEKANGIGKNDAISVRTNPTDRNNLNPFRRYFSSPSRLAEKADVHGFKSFYTFGTRAMNKLTKLRADFTRKLNEAMAYVEKNKIDKEALYDILWQGDAEGKEYTKKQLQEMGASDNVIKAYGLIRNQMRKAYRLLNEARTRVQTKSAIVSDAKLQELNGNKFVEILSQKETPQGTLVTYKEKANWIKTYLVDEETLDRFYQDENMQVISAAEVGQNEDGDKLYSVEAREAIPDINKLGGYIPHFFHEYMVREKTEDGFKVVASGRNVKEAYQKAEEYIKNNPDAELSIAPKAFDFSALGLDEKNLGALVGDEDYDKMAEVISAKSDVDLKSAKEFLDGIAHKKGRHRFFGNFLQRKGAKGFEQDLDWVLRHYFNAASRYVAMETEFKPKAISLFERLYGRFDDDHSGVAKYVKEYINDLNGNPAVLEQAINNLLNSSRLWRALAGTRYGERAALQLANDITGKIAVAKLGFFNVSSALINLTQLANAAAYLGDVGTLWQGLRRGAKKHYTMHEQRVLMETNVLHDIGLDSGSGYGKASFGNLANKTMVLFKTTESIARKGTVLAAYDKSIRESDVYKKAVADGMSKAEAYQKACKDTATHQEAIAYAKEVNIKSNFDYGVNDAPNMMRRGSILGQLFYQFKKYPIKQMEVMQDFAPVFSNKTSAKQKAIFWGTQFLLAGLFGSIPFWKLLDSLWEEIFGTSPEKEIKKSIMLASANDPLLKELAKVTMYGLGAAANVDISARVGLGDIVPSRASDLVGPALSSVKGVLSNGFNGDGVAALRSFSPGLANVYMAATGKSVGARNRTTSVYDGAYDRLLRLLGFRSADEAVASDIQGIIYNDKDKLADEKKAAIDEYLANPTTANAKRLKELGVKPKTVKDERKRKEQDKLERAEGALSKKDRKSKSNNDLFQFAR